MAPEQLAGGEVTPRSDIYSLGLVLYELFTGRRALEGRNLAELIAKREQDGITHPSEIVRDLDPAIDRAIMRCLEPDPARRPSSALAVAASLPGGDPLAAALAAGETPSPEMVAAAGDDERAETGRGARRARRAPLGLPAGVVSSSPIACSSRASCRCRSRRSLLVGARETDPGDRSAIRRASIPRTPSCRPTFSATRRSIPGWARRSAWRPGVRRRCTSGIAAARR